VQRAKCRVLCRVLCRVRPRSLAAGVLLLGCMFVPTAVSAGQRGANTGWSRLTTVPAGTAVVVMLADGRSLQRLIVNAGPDVLVVADVARVHSSADREALLNLLRNDPIRFAVSASVVEAGRSIAVVERFDRRSILCVARPSSHGWDPGLLGWFLAGAGPCPNCDAAQTLRRVGPATGTSDHIPGPFNGRTVLPSPLPATHPATGEVLYAAQLLDPAALPATLTWPRLHEWLAAPAFRLPPDRR
jgi:hypothetical protein